MSAAAAVIVVNNAASLAVALVGETETSTAGDTYEEEDEAE